MITTATHFALGMIRSWAVLCLLLLAHRGSAANLGSAEMVLRGVDGLKVHCTVYRPSPVYTGPVGLVVHLYGAGGSLDNFNAGGPSFGDLRRLLAKRGYWLVVPELGPRHWMNEAACNGVDATIDAMIAQEHVDRRRVHLLGTSMGGGCSLIYVMLRPGRIKSVAAIFPMTDFSRWLDETPRFRSIFDEAHGLTVGREGDALRRFSPLFHPLLFKGTPIFLLHGDHDTVVPPHHSREFAAALTSAGAKVIYHEVPGETHRDEIALHYQVELADFLTKED